MGTINYGYIDRVKYILACEQLGSEITITEPVGWNEDQKEFARNTDYDGIVAKFSNSLKFIGDGADYIELAYELYDVIAKIKMTKYECHPRTDKWVKTYWGYLDLLTRQWEDGKLSVKFNSGGLQEDIKSREDESVEIDRTTTISGQTIEPITENDVLLEGRRIFLKSKWEVKNTDNHVAIDVGSRDGNTRNKIKPFPLAIVEKSHEQAQTSSSFAESNESQGTTSLMILAMFDRTRDVVIVGKGLEFYFKLLKTEWDWAEFKICLTTYSGSDYNLKKRQNLFFARHDGNYGSVKLWDIHNKTLKIPDFRIPVPVNENDSIAIEIYIKSDLRNGSGNKYFEIDMSNIKGTVFAEEDSHFEQSTSKCYLAHDLLKQLTTICSNNKNAFYSEYFGRTDLGYKTNGPGAYVATTHGFAIRGFNKYPLPDPDNGIENLYKPMTTSLRDALSSFKSVFNVGVGIEEVNGKERLRVEELSYFYNNNVTIKLPNQVKNVKRKTAVEYYWPSIEVGYEDGYENEEAQGLDEPNGKSNFTTIINKEKNVFSKLSKYIGGMYAQEFIRRKPFLDFPSEDTKHDDSVFLLDLKPGNNNVFLQRKWQDDFEKAPTGIFSPDTAVNLRFSPVNMLLRHGWMISSGLTKYPTEKIRYGSSTANSQLKTKLIRGNEYAENDNILNSELAKARFVPEWVEFEHECNFDIMQMVQGVTRVNGKDIPNFYGTVQFINEKNQVEKGFLFNLKPNGNGQWKVLKSNRQII